MIKNFFITAFRNLAKNRVHTILNIMGLALGVLTTLTIGIWLKREISFDNFHAQQQEIFRITNTFKSESESFSQAPSGSALGAQLPKHIPSIKSSCRLFNELFKVKAGNEIFIEKECMTVDSNFFSFFNFPLISGHPDKVLTDAGNVVLTEKLAIKYFGSAANAMGKQLMLDGDFPKIISGVAADVPANSHIRFDLLLPFAHLRKIALEQWKFDIDNSWPGGWPHTYIRVADPARWKETEEQVNRVVAKFSEKEWKENKMSYRYHLQPISDIHLKSNLRYDAKNNGSLARVRIFSIVGLIVLLLACINYINLTTAGAIKRAKETSVRKLVGATRGQLVRRFFMETLLVCTIAVLLGVLLLQILLPLFSRWIGEDYHLEVTYVNTLMILGFIITMSVIAGVYPSFILSSFRPALSLKGSFSLGRTGNIIRKSLVIFQFTIGIALVVSLIIISLQMDFIKRRALGFNGKSAVEVRFFGEQKVIEQYGSIRNQLLQSPYILNVSKHSQNVVGGLGNGWTTTESLKGDEISTSLYQMSADTSFFETYDMKLAAGRFFSRDFPTDSTKSVIVNEAAVRTFGWQKPENAIGKRFGKGDEARFVIGVVKDFNFEPLHKPVEALLIGYARGGNMLTLKIDTRYTDEALNHLQKTWTSMVPDIPLQYAFVDETINQQYGNEKRTLGIFYAFAGLSLLIACLGLFGLSIYVVERRVKEIGIRKVLGAKVGGIVTLLSKDFLKLVFIAFVIATPLSWIFMKQWLQDFAYRINISWWVFAAAGWIAIAIAVITVSFQAIKAAVRNPVKSLRTE
jgi:putative ABC transport system permease protein